MFYNSYTSSLALLIVFYKVWIILNYMLSIASIAILAWKAVTLVKAEMLPKSALFNAFDMIGEKNL